MIHHLSGCEVYVDQDNNLECCDPEDTLKCEAAHMLSPTVHTVVNSCIGRDRYRCGGGYIWSKFREQCVQLFRGAAPVKQEADQPENTTEGPSETETETSSVTEIQTNTQDDIIVTTNSPQNIEDL